MGYTPIPCIPPPKPTFEEELRRELTPRRDYGELLNLALVALVLCLLFIPLIWWAA